MKQYKLEIFNGNKIKVTMNPVNIFESRTEWVGSTKPKRKGLMTQAEYFRTMRIWAVRLFKLDIESKNCKFITLTLAEDMEWQTLMLKFTAFMNSVKNNFGRDVKYIRVVDVQHKSQFFHIHLVLVFENGLPQELNRLWVEKHWKYGFVDVDDEKNVTDIFGLANYLTLNKIGKPDLIDGCFTKYPCGVSIVSTNMETFTPKRTIAISEEELEHLLDVYENNKDPYSICTPRFLAHYYNDNGKQRYCRDKILIKASKEFIESNYGTAEDFVDTKEQTPEDDGIVF